MAKKREKPTSVRVAGQIFNEGNWAGTGGTRAAAARPSAALKGQVGLHARPVYGNRYGPGERRPLLAPDGKKWTRTQRGEEPAPEPTPEPAPGPSPEVGPGPGSGPALPSSGPASGLPPGSPGGALPPGRGPLPASRGPGGAPMGPVQGSPPTQRARIIRVDLPNGGPLSNSQFLTHEGRQMIDMAKGPDGVYRKQIGMG